jgi:purine-binding chemotaxis protein CheW
MSAKSDKNMSTNKQSSPETGKKKNVKQLGGKYLTFFLANEEYGLEILKVVEIIGMMDVTPVPRTPRYIQGVINLRGKVIPVMDLRLKFGMPHIEQTDETVIIVVHAQGIEMGIVVDKVSEVLDINNESIEDSPAFGTEVNTEYILGIGKADGNVKLLLDIDRVLTSQDIVDMQAAKTKEESSIETEQATD